MNLRSVPYGCYINSVCINHIMYADDTVLIAPSPVALQKLIDLAGAFFTTNGLVKNKNKKTKCMAVKPDCLKDLHVPNFYLEGSRITEVKTKDHLGYIITEDFADDQPINKEIRSVYARGNMFDWKFKFCSGEVKRRLFITYFTSLYCCSLWCCFSPKTLLKLKVAHNNILRQFYKLQGGPSTSISHHIVTMDNLTSTLLEDWYIVSTASFMSFRHHFHCIWALKMAINYRVNILIRTIA